ncbi:hypothetical protein MHU86_20998 [Fragilaria crotonensis]|nr:hypothetical protein MHU86_20998 [Fragilaria crotonensis]
MMISTDCQMNSTKEPPLHISIEGPTTEACENAEQLVEAPFVANADQAETMVDDAPSSTVSAPTAVNGACAEWMGTSQHPWPVSLTMPAWRSEVLSWRNKLVSRMKLWVQFLGEEVNPLRPCKREPQGSDSKENEMQPGQTQRVITLQAATKEAIDQCRSIIQSMVNERTQTTSTDMPFENNSQESGLQEAL